MLFSGSRGAPYTCLRCQLRQAIFQSRPRCIDRTRIQTKRSYTATPHRREHEDDPDTEILETQEFPHGRDVRPIKWHHPLGRIVGEPGKRQRQRTQTLNIDAMKKPFEVIVMQDVREAEVKRVKPTKLHNGTALSAAQIERDMAREGEDPTQEEVNESISDLRPDTTLLDEEQYRELAKSLAEGFTTEQLHAFFTESINLSAVESDEVHVISRELSELQKQHQRTQWRPGRTRIEKRLPIGTVVKKSEKPKKPKLVEQILRLTWNLSIHAEEQKVGELEIKLQSWEMAYLFDLPHIRGDPNAKAMYESFVGSPFLLRACEIRPYRPQGYVRISGRRQDAEEVAQKLQEQLLTVGILPFKLAVFAPLLGTPGWPATFKTLFRKEDISYVQRQTLTVIEQPQPGTFYIYSPRDSRQVEARRLLLAFLEFPTLGSTKAIWNAATQGNVAALPEPAGTMLHIRHRKLGLTRLTFPTRIEKLEDGVSPPGKRSAETSLSRIMRSLAALISRQLAKAKPTQIFDPVPETPQDPKAPQYWHINKVAPSPWRAQLCRLLHADPDRQNPTPARHKKTGKPPQTEGLILVNAQTRHLESLLSFFTPREVDPESSSRNKSAPVLIARLVPQPFTNRGIKAMTDLPPVELAYRSFVAEDGTPDVRFVGARATLKAQEVRVPLPSEATDVQFQQATILHAREGYFREWSGIEAFTQRLRQTLRETKTGALLGLSHVTIPLPQAVVAREGGPVDSREGVTHVPIHYMFMGFEQTHRREYRPLDVEMLPARMDPRWKAVLAGFGDKFLLQLREVSAGVVGGTRTEVGVAYRPGWKTGEFEEAAYGGAEYGGDAHNESESETDTTAGGKKDANSEYDLALQDPESKEAITAQLVELSLGVARMLTKLNSGELQPMLHHKSFRQDEVAQADEEEQEEKAADAVGEQSQHLPFRPFHPDESLEVDGAEDEGKAADAAGGQ